MAKCQALSVDHPVTGNTWWKQRFPTQKTEYAQMLLDLLMGPDGKGGILQDLKDSLGSWDLLAPDNPPADVPYLYPTFSDILDYRPEPIDPHPVFPPPPDEYRPEFIDLDPIPTDNIPEYDVTTYVPDFPDRPDDSVPAFTVEVPTIDNSIEKPVKPDYEMPAEPTLFWPTIPDVPQFSFPTFDDELAEYNFVEPASYVTPGDLSYSSTLNDAVKDKLEHDVIHGGTGLAADVEDAIWRREEERSLIAHYDAMDQIADEFGRRGFVMPPQMLSGALMVEKVNYTNKRLDTSRDISIKQAELADQNTRWAVEQGNAFEKMMIDHFNTINMRVFEASKSTVGYGIEIYRANIERYNVLASVYRTRADVWKAMIDGEILKVQGYLAQIEGAKAVMALSQMSVDVYKTKVEAINTLINMYRTEMEAAKLSLEMEGLKIDLFKAQVDAYVAQVNGKTAEFNLYGVEVDAEKAMIGAWVSQIDAYKARVEAAKLSIEAHASRIGAQAETNKSLATVYGADVDAYKAEVSGVTAELDGEVRVYEGKVRGYEADVKAWSGMGGLQLEVIKTRLDEYKTEQSLILDFKKLELSNYLDYHKIWFGVAETEAQVVAQVAAAAMNADSFTTHLSESHSFGNSNQVSCIDQHYYEETTV